MPEKILILSAVLGVGFLGTRLAALVRLPHSVFMILLGLIGGLILTQVKGPLEAEAMHHFPEVVLYVLLPPLIFESAYNLNLTHLRRDLACVLSLATVGLLLSCVTVGLGLHLGLGLEMRSALLFGALISATDPVAVVALFKTVGAPRRLATMVEGESLLNDATAIVLFRVLLAGIVSADGGGPSSIAGALLQFALVSLGGLATGAVFVFAISRMLRFTSDFGAGQMGLTVACAYASYVVADHLLGVSGVMSTMTVGAYLGSQARLHYNRQALHAMHALWECLALAANSLVFLAVGWIADPALLWSMSRFIPATIALAIGARALAVVATVEAVNRGGLGPAVSRAYQAVLVWAGLRGGLALALVLLLPHGFVDKQLFLGLATSVVLFSLIVNALTTAPLLRRLRLHEMAGNEVALFCSTLSELVRHICGGLQGAVMRGTIAARVIDGVRGTAVAAIEEASAALTEPARRDLTFDLSRVLLAEQRYFDERLEDATLSTSAYRALTATVRARLLRLRSDGLDGLRDYPLAAGSALAAPGKNPDPSGGRLGLPGRARMADVTVELETLLHGELALKEAARYAKGETLQSLVSAWTSAVRARLDAFQRSFPQLDVVVQYRFVSRMVVSSARGTIDELLDNDVIGPAVHRRVSEIVEIVDRRLEKEVRRRLHGSLDDLLAATPLFDGLPPHGRAAVAQAARRFLAPSGTLVVREDETGSSFFLVLSGLLEVRGRVFDALESQPRLFAGSFFGEISLLFDTPRTATVTALVDSELLELSRASFEHIARDFPQLKTRLEAEAAARLARSDASPRASAALRSVPLLSLLTSEELDSLTRRARRLRVPAQHVVVQAGQPGDSLFVVLSGAVTAGDGARLGVGGAFGERSLLLGTPREATVRAERDTDLLEIDRAAFGELIDHPQVQRHLWEMVETSLGHL